MIKKFLEDIRELKSLAHNETRSWLKRFPMYMQGYAIPLFMDGDGQGDNSVDYQLHPRFSSLELRKNSTRPQDGLRRLSLDDSMLEDPDLIIGIGRLFVNTGHPKLGRTSKWTGYEVFVDKELALWMVFDRRSIDPTIDSRAKCWYPISCGLSSLDHQDSGEKGRQHSNTSTRHTLTLPAFYHPSVILRMLTLKWRAEKCKRPSSQAK